MKIKIASYQSVMMIRGGPHVKITETKRHLEELSVQVELFNMWEPAEKMINCDLVYLFGANIGDYHFARSLMERNVRFVVNPIFYTRHSARTIKAICSIDKFSKKLMRGFWWEYCFTRDICQWAEHVLPNTRAEGDLIAKGMAIQPQKIEVIPNGVSKKFLSGNPKLFQQKYGVKDFILNVGHIGPDRKNVLALVKALEGIDRPAVIIGRITPGGEAEAVLAEAQKNNKLVIIDGIDHDDPLLASAYAACDTFVLPSKFETPGRAALEAALAGAKIVITPHGGTKEYFGNLAEYVDPYSVNSIRAGIERALNRPMTPNLREHVKDNFLWDRIAQKTVAVFEYLLSKKP
jgi:glycosyltransferase involved in cell wall biosynthesis